MSADPGDPACVAGALGGLEVIPESPLVKDTQEPDWLPSLLSKIDRMDSKLDKLALRVDSLEEWRLAKSIKSGSTSPARSETQFATPTKHTDTPHPVAANLADGHPKLSDGAALGESRLDHVQKHVIQGAARVSRLPPGIGNPLYSPGTKTFIQHTPPQVRGPRPSVPLAAAHFQVENAHLRVDQAGIRMSNAFFPGEPPPPPPRLVQPPSDQDPSVLADHALMARLRVKLAEVEAERDELHSANTRLRREWSQLQHELLHTPVQSAGPHVSAVAPKRCPPGIGNSVAHVQPPVTPAGPAVSIKDVVDLFIDKDSTVPVSRIEKFTGKADNPVDVGINAKLYLAALSRVHRAKDSDAKKVNTFLSNLSDPASVWALNLPPDISYAELVDRFSLRFGVTLCVEHALAEFNSLRRGDKPLETHVQRFQKLASVLHDMPLANLKQKFCDSLGVMHGPKLYSDSQYPHMCLEDLFAAARRLETASMFGVSQVASAHAPAPAHVAAKSFVFGQSSGKNDFGKPAFTPGFHKDKHASGASGKPKQLKVHAVMAPEVSNTTTSAPFPEKESGVEWDCAVEDSCGKLWWWDGNALRPVFETVEQ